MNNKEKDILYALYSHGFVTQRKLQNYVPYSLGVINEGLKWLRDQEYIDGDNNLLDKGRLLVESYKPKRAVILSAGYGMRMVPINTESPKGLLTVKGQVLIERLILQLKEAGVEEITVVVGFMKEKFEYLIDKYHVKLVVNKEYAEKNNLWTLSKVGNLTDGCFVVPSNLYCKDNPFLWSTLYSWYMVAEGSGPKSRYNLNRKRNLTVEHKGSGRYKALKIGYISREDGQKFTSLLKEKAMLPAYEQSKWEALFFENNNFIINGRVWEGEKVMEISTYEDLREADSSSDQLKSDAIDIICQSFNVPAKDIKEISVLKKGMTNRSFIFSIANKRYIMRIPGEGSEQMINRKEEAEVYEKLKGLKICDRLIYINPENGYKISEYMEGARECDPHNEDDLRICMAKLKKFHNLNLQVGHSFDLYGMLEYYEELMGHESVYSDYAETKRNVLSLKDYVDKQEKQWILTHIDANPDNFLIFSSDGSHDLKDQQSDYHEEGVRLIDWEYAGMNDPHLDIAMFAIYALYDKKELDRLMEIYFGSEPDSCIVTKIYCYVAIGGLLWSNWCEYKKKLGVEFGEYSLKQYRYAKDFYRLAKARMDEETK